MARTAKEEYRGAKPLHWRQSKVLPGIANAKAKKFITRRYIGEFEEAPRTISKSDWKDPTVQEEIVNSLTTELSRLSFRKYWQRHRERPASGRKYHRHATGKERRPEYYNAQFGFQVVARSMDGSERDFFGWTNNDFSADKDFNLSKYIKESIDYIFSKYQHVELTIEESHWRWYNPGE